MPTIIVAHEFYDALPVHQFQVPVCSISTANTCRSIFMKRCKWSAKEEVEKLNHIEICPKAMDLTHPAFMFIFMQANRKHKFVNILDAPGSADLSAYVDFASIRHSAQEVRHPWHGPITQSQFLGSLGINFRVEALLQNYTDEQAESLRTGYWGLVGEGEAPFWEGPDEEAPNWNRHSLLGNGYPEQEARNSE
ncbi:hypothetical protein Tsubulata_051382 [Turnera subulata]|uniref:Protein arginine methyltransferase NDUFAF7 n=1 Tax=Turnera subulata TaxID=218843 RepID=A0A9Q0JH67_9ROSI|nr:hypothetical protein Tsubulata_051382 [Turnera subulata]